MTTTKSEYDIQAETFLTKAGIKFTLEYIKTGPYFDDDVKRGVSRDIYKLSLTRMKFRHGMGPTKKTYSTKFGASQYDTERGMEPTPYDLLSCITKYDPGTFENFCDESGYDTDSRRAEKTWKLVSQDWRKVQAFFTEKEIEALQEIN